MLIPVTSVEMLRDVANLHDGRWTEFHALYRPMMDSYLKARFPSLDADDVIQETFMALWQKSVYEIALQQLLKDESIHGNSKQVFVRLVIDEQSTEQVSEETGIKRATVNRIKERMVCRLRNLVAVLKEV